MPDLTVYLGRVEGGRGGQRPRRAWSKAACCQAVRPPVYVCWLAPVFWFCRDAFFSVYFKREGEKGRENRTGVCSPWSNSPFFFLSQVYSFWTGLSKFRLGEVGDVGVEMPGSWTCKAKGAFTLEFKRERERGCGILVQHTMYYIHVRYPRHMTGHHFGVLFFPPLGRSCRLSIPHSF